MEGEVSIEIVQKPKVIFWYKTCFSVLFFFQDQYDVIDKHTQSGLDLLDRYIKFVKERSEIEQNYAKQLRCGPSECLFIFIWNGILNLFFCVCSHPMHASQVDVFTLFQQKSHKEICQTRKQGRSRLQVRKQKLVSSSSLSCIVTFLHFSSYFFICI